MKKQYIAPDFELNRLEQRDILSDSSQWTGPDYPGGETGGGGVVATTPPDWWDEP